MPRVQFWKEYSLKYFTSFLVYFSFLFSQKCWVCVRLYQWIVRNRTLPHTKEVIYYTLFTPSCNTRTHTSLGSHILCCVEKLHRQWRGKVTHSIMRSLNKSRFLWCMSESSYWQQLYTLLLFPKVSLVFCLNPTSIALFSFNFNLKKKKKKKVMINIQIIITLM